MKPVNKLVLNKLELMTLEIVKAEITHKGIYYPTNMEDLINRAENIALALYNRFEENNSEE